MCIAQILQSHSLRHSILFCFVFLPHLEQNVFSDWVARLVERDRYCISFVYIVEYIYIRNGNAHIRILSFLFLFSSFLLRRRESVWRAADDARAI